MNIYPHELELLIGNIIIKMKKDNYKPDLILGLTRGGLIPAVRISHLLDVPMKAVNKDLEALHTTAKEELNQNVLILDDINDTGNTLSEIACILNFYKNINASYAVIIENKASLFKGVNYSGMTIDKSVNPCWVNFPWERK